ncbi:hypothetical protein LQW54_008932 [Pestalotiopsis sp. IQ-011]
MEALGAAPSIIAVLEVSGKVLSHIRSAKGAKKDRQRLRDEVQACDDMLQQLQDNVDDPGEDMAWSEKITALGRPGAPLYRLHVTLTIINDKLEDSSKTGSRFSEIVASLKWPFDEKEVDKLLLLQKIEETSIENNQYLKELLWSLEDTSRSWEGHFLQLEVGVDTMIRSQETQEERENNRTILDWLSPLDFTSQQNDFIRRRQADTGLWLLQSEEYQHWVTTAKETLFCPGMPGAGKTIIASIVIEDLYERYRNQSKFLLAQLHMDSLVDTTTIRSVRTALQRLGRGTNAYGSAYDDAMERINGQSENRKELALRVLMWITCAKWQLTIHQLQHALAVQIDEPSLDEDDFVDINDIISVCAGLVTIDEQSNIVRLVHYTTQEYFQRQEIQEKWFPAAQDAIFMVCTTYLG